MERDFMGLNPVKESVAAVKDEVSNGVSDSAVVTLKAQGTHQLPFGNKVASAPHFLSPITAQEDTSNKITSGFTQNLAGFLGRQSPSATHVAGLADSRNRSAGSPAQMTIFYNGTVKVYDLITPEKAQAIMSLAANASCIATCDARVGAQIRPPTPKLVATDVTVPVNRYVDGQPSLTISSPVAVSSHNHAQSMSSSTSTDERVASKPTLSPFSPDCKMDPPTKPVNAFGNAAAPSTMPRGIPQFRKVSLARFLEKRKERAMNAAPYKASKKPECTS